MQREKAPSGTSIAQQRFDPFFVGNAVVCLCLVIWMIAVAQSRQRMQGRLNAYEVERKDLVTQAERVREELSELRAKTSRQEYAKVAAVQKKGDPHSAPGSVIQISDPRLMADPANLNHVAMLFRFNVASDYDYILNKFGLTEDIAATIENLLVERQLSQFDASVVQRQVIAKPLTPDELQQLAVPSTEQIRALIGAEHWAQFEEYEKSLPYRKSRVMQLLDARLSIVGTPLSADVRDAVSTLLANGKADILRAPRAVPEDMVRQISNHLTPSQYAQFSLLNAELQELSTLNSDKRRQSDD